MIPGAWEAWASTGGGMDTQICNQLYDYTLSSFTRFWLHTGPFAFVFLFGLFLFIGSNGEIMVDFDRK